MHPFVENLSELSNEVLLAKINDLYDRLRSSMRLSNPDYTRQLRMILEDYQGEYNRRMAKAEENSANKSIFDKIRVEK